MRNWLGYLVFNWEVWNTWAWRVSLLQDLQWLEISWSSTRSLPSLAVGDVEKARGESLPLLFLASCFETEAIPLIPAYAAPQLTQVHLCPLLYHYCGPTGQLPDMVWPWSLSLDPILTQTCLSTFWVLAGALICLFTALGSLENQLVLTGLWHIQHDFGSAHISSSGQDHTAESQWFQPPTKSKIYYNAHFLTKYYKIGFICAFSNILLNRKQQRVEQDFFLFFLSLKNTKNTNRRMPVSISTPCWTPLTCTHTCINMGMTYFQHSRVSVVVT